MHEQVVSQTITVLAGDWRIVQNDRSDRIGGVFARCASQLYAQWVVQPGILSASKTIQAESDLIHYYSGRKAEGF
jgi:hypothetical protein